MSKHEIFIARLLFAYRGGETKRFHCENTLRAQSVAEHSFGVAWVASLLADDYPEARQTQLLIAALTHDIAEHMMGDIPSPAKRMLGLVEIWDAAEQGHLTAVGLQIDDQLNDTERRIIKFADCIDGVMFCCRERSLGNRNMNHIYTNYRKYLDELGANTDRERWLLEAVDELWRRYDG